jgi:hypothetical protein
MVLDPRPVRPLPSVACLAHATILVARSACGA